MQPVMGVQDVLEFEKALAEKGLRSQELMRRAGAVVALQTAKLVDRGSVVVLCGMGNNGGDGWVAADNLARHGYEVNIVSGATPALIKGEVPRRMASRAAEMGIPVHVDPGYDELVDLLEQADVVVDAVFGTGFKGTMPAPYDMWVEAVEDAFEGMVVSVDVPSGINAETGMSAGPHFTADVTVTMFAVKPGLVSGEGRFASGTVVVASLTPDDEGLSDISNAAAAFTLEDADYAGVLPAVDPLDDKYTRGRVLVVAGSVRYPGAALLAATAAARSGAGYVTLAVPQPVVALCQAGLPSVPVVGLPADEEGSFGPEAADRVAALAARADVVLAGPGMTTSFGAAEVVRSLLAAPVALVLDADALNVLVKVCTGSAEEHPEPLRREWPLVLTPHRRELARLVGAEAHACASLAGAMHTAQHLAWSVGSADFAVIAKGPVTAVATIDSTLVPEPGPAALATAGTGDVLSGLVAGVLAQHLAQEGGEGIGSSDLLMLMAAADRVHAVAGYLAVREHGSRGVIATDVAAKVGLALDAFEAAVERAYDDRDEDAGSRLEGALAFEDESRIKPPPEVERLIRADAAARVVRLAVPLSAFDDDLEEPEPAPAPAPEALEALEAPGVPSAEATGVIPPVGAGAGAPEVAPDRTTVMPALAAAAPQVPEPAPAPGDAADVRAPQAPQAASPATPVAAAGGVPPFLSAVVPGGEGDDPAAATQSASLADAAVASGAPQGDDAVPADPVFAPVPVAPVPSAERTTVMAPVGTHAPSAEESASAPQGEPPLQVPPFLARAAAGAPAAEAQGDPEPEPAEEPVEELRELTPEELRRLRQEWFHEQATYTIEGDEVTPVDERPSAKPRRRR